MQIKNNLFDLTPEQEETSKMMYDGKIVKCLVAPYHSYAQLEKIVPYTKNTYLFPERELSVAQIKGLISMIVKSPSTEEFRIITANQNVILDMVDDCVRVLTEAGNLVDCPVKTFMANIHTIRYKVLENEEHQLSKADKTQAHDKVQQLIDAVSETKSISKSEFDQLIREIDMIGEPIISSKIKELAYDNLTIK